MGWIKRNLFFLIGTLVAVALIGGGVFYLMDQMNKEREIADKIQEEYGHLEKLTREVPHPGQSGKVDNVQAAKDRQALLSKYVGNVRAPYFKRIPLVPDLPPNRLNNSEFSRQLGTTVAQLRRDADQQRVKLPPEYCFTFQSQMNIMSIDSASIGKLAMHLGEIKVICGILFDGGITTLERLQRERVPPTDKNVPDYLPDDMKTVSGPLAEITPYQVTFQCFTGSLAEVLGDLAASPHGFVVRAIDVVPAVATVANAPAPTMPGVGAPAPRFPPRGAGARAGAAAPTARGGAVTILDEHVLRVTLLIEVIKPKSR